MEASIKIMLSYDYCHFEICLGHNVESIAEADALRKDAQRLADKAVHQYKTAKSEAMNMCYNGKKQELERQVKIIRENFPQSEWTPEQKATVKALADFEYYDYQDDWEGR